jgi:circadian clock protein KaiB
MDEPIIPQFSTDDFENSAKKADGGKFMLRLYVTGSTPQSLRAINNIQKICKENLDGNYNLEVINLYENPELAKTEQIIAAPTLVKQLPLPLRRIIGDLSNSDKVLVGLGLRVVE